MRCELKGQSLSRAVNRLFLLTSLGYLGQVQITQEKEQQTQRVHFRPYNLRSVIHLHQSSITEDSFCTSHTVSTSTTVQRCSYWIIFTSLICMKCYCTKHVL